MELTDRPAISHRPQASEPDPSPSGQLAPGICNIGIRPGSPSPRPPNHTSRTSGLGHRLDGGCLAFELGQAEAVGHIVLVDGADIVDGPLTHLIGHQLLNVAEPDIGSSPAASALALSACTRFGPAL